MFDYKKITVALLLSIISVRIQAEGYQWDDGRTTSGNGAGGKTTNNTINYQKLFALYSFYK